MAGRACKGKKFIELRQNSVLDLNRIIKIKLPKDILFYDIGKKQKEEREKSSKREKEKLIFHSMFAFRISQRWSKRKFRY